MVIAKAGRTLNPNVRDELPTAGGRVDLLLNGRADPVSGRARDRPVIFPRRHYRSGCRDN